MKAVLAAARAELRARLLSILALALLLGLSSGAVMTLAAGARRTDSAYGRFAREHLAADMVIYGAFDSARFYEARFDEVSTLPQIAAAGRQHFIGSIDPNLFPTAPDATYGKTINVPELLEGRMPHEDSLDEVAVSFTLAQNRKLRVGRTISVEFADREFRPIPTTLRIVGIEASPGEFPPLLGGFGGGDGGILHLSPALFESLTAKEAFSLDFIALRFKRGAADFAAVNDKLSELADAADPEGGGLPQLNQNLGAQAANVQRSIHLQAVALRIVAALVALIAILVLSQLIARQASLDAVESPTLRALGMTRRQVSATGLFRSGIVGVVAAVIGLVTAIAASTLMPIGLARLADTQSGPAFDPLVLGLGALVTVLGVVALAAWPMWKNARAVPEADLGSQKPSFVARATAASGSSPAMTTGVSLALEPGRGRTAVPVRSSLMSVTLAIVGLSAALTFGAGLDHLLSTPNQYGWNWDVRIGTDDEEIPLDPAIKALRADPAVEAVAIVDTPPVAIGDVRFDAIVLEQSKGVIEPRVLEGRAPRAKNEVALGARTLRDLDAHIGSTVHASISAVSGGGADFTIVGVVVVPPNSDTTRLGSGGVFTREGELAMVPQNFTALPPLTETYVSFVDGVNQEKALDRISKELGEGYYADSPVQPRDLVNFGQVQNLPLVLAGLVAILAAATLGHTLITSIRRRRRDLAVLKMLGFVPRQVRTAVAWQATTFVSAALVIGLPVGVVAGRAVWTLFARGLGVPPEPATPSLQLLLTIPAAVLLANAIAAIPAVVAGRMRPAPALRAE